MLFYRPEDLGLRRFFAGGGPDEEQLRRVATLLHEHGGTVTRRASCATTVGVGPPELTGLVNLLEQAGAVEVDRPRRAALRRRRARARRGRGAAPWSSTTAAATVDDSRIDMMRGYAETTGCRRRFLLEYFGEPYARRLRALRHLPGGAAPSRTHGDGPVPDARRGAARRRGAPGMVHAAAETATGSPSCSTRSATRRSPWRPSSATRC